MHALPVNQPRDWLIASHVPWLLSKQVASEQNIVTWAASVANATATDPNDRIMTDAARALYKVSREVFFLAASRTTDAICRISKKSPRLSRATRTPWMTRTRRTWS